MAEIILIRPQFSKDNWRESRPPAGLLYIAATLIRKKYNVIIIDQSVEDDWESRLINALDENTLFVGITCLTGYMIINGIKIAKITSKYSQCPIVWGGVHPTLEPDSTIASEYVDIIVVGEGEETAVELANALKFEEELKNVDGIIYKSFGKIVKNKHRAIYNLNELPPLPLHLVRLELYRNHPGLNTFFNFKNPLALSIESSRGCTHRCSYCVQSNAIRIETGNSSWRYMKAEKIVDMIESIVEEHGIKSFSFIEDNFFVHHGRTKTFLDELERRKLNIEWFADIRMDTITKKMDIPFLKRLEKNGLRSLGIGIESGSDKMLKHIHKGETVETYIEANRMLAHIKIIAHYGFILGLPYEKKEDVVKSYKLIIQLFKDNPCAAPTVNKLLPSPNTPIMEDCVKLGFKKPEKFEDWPSYCDTGWFNGPDVWMDNESAEFIMSQRLFQSVVTMHGANRGFFWSLIYRMVSGLLLFRIEREFYSFRIEGFLMNIIRRPRVMSFLRKLFILSKKRKTVCSR